MSSENKAAILSLVKSGLGDVHLDRFWRTFSPEEKITMLVEFGFADDLVEHFADRFPEYFEPEDAPEAIDFEEIERQARSDLFYKNLEYRQMVGM